MSPSPSHYEGLHRRYRRILSDTPSLLAAMPDEDEIRSKLSSLFSGMMRAAYDSKASEFSVEILAEPAVRKFIDGHASILDSSFKQTSMSDHMRRQLHKSDWIFSGMKTFHELNEAFPSICDSNGVRKPFEQFLKDVQSVDSTYNARYLRAEYNFVAASAEMAAKWEDFARDGDRYNLQYRTQDDDHVRPEHAVLNGITLPPSDPFWQQFYPPNGWNCRCTVVQVRKSKYPDTSSADAMALGEQALEADPKGMFRFNPGIEESTVPAYNPYTISKCKKCKFANHNQTLAKDSIPSNQVCDACRWFSDCWRKKIDVKKKGVGISNEEKDRILSLPKDQQFSVEYVGAKGKVCQHLLVCDAAGDHEIVLAVARAFADMDGDCLMNPELRDTQPRRREYYSQLPSEAKCNPDLFTHSFGYVDVKSPEQPDNWARNAIHASKDQYSCVCLTNSRTPIDKKEIPKWNNNIWRDSNYHHNYIFWFIDGTLHKYKRP